MTRHHAYALELLAPPAARFVSAGLGVGHG